MRTFSASVVLGLVASACGSHADDTSYCADEVSCENDVSSLLQLPLANLREQRLLSSQGKREDSCPEVGARAYVTTAALAYVTNELFPFAYTGIQDGLLPMDPIFGGAAGFNYDISNIRLRSFAATSAVFELVEGRGIKVHVADVALLAVMDYKLSSNSFWTSLFPDSEGVLSATIGSGSFVSLTAVLGPSAAPMNITLEEVDSQLNIRKLDFNAPGRFDSFLNVMTSVFKPLVQRFVRDAVTELIAKQSFDIAAAVDGVLENNTLPFPLKNETGPAPYNVAVRLCGFAVGSEQIAVDAYALVDSTANGANDSPGYGLSATGFAPDQSTMFGVGVTERTVNGFVWLARRVVGLLAPESALLKSSGPVPSTAETGTLDDGRVLKAPVQDPTEYLAKQLQQQLLEEAGVSIRDLSVQLFSQAVGVVADVELDLRKLLDVLLGEESRSHTKLGSAATKEHDRLDPPAAAPAAAMPAAVLSPENDVSSLLQLPLSNVRQQRLLPSQGNREDSCPEVGARAYVTSAALAYVTNELFPFAYTDIQDGLLPMDPIVGGAAGFNYDISNIRLRSFAATSAAFELVEGRGIKVHVADVALLAVMDYKLSSNSFWTSLFPDSEGVLSATIGSGSFVSLTAVLGPSAAPMNITLEEVDSELNIRKLDFNAPGRFDSFLNVMTSVFKPLVQRFVRDAVTELIAKQSFDIAAAVDGVLENNTLPFPLKNETGPAPYNVEVRLCGFAVGSEQIAVDAYALVDSTASGANDGHGYGLSTTGFAPDQSTMFGVGVTERTVNGFVWLARRVVGLLAPEGALLKSSGPVPSTAETGTLDDGRVLKAPVQDPTEYLAKQLQKQLLEEAGVSISDLSVQLFSQAVGVVADVELDLRKLLDVLLGEESRSHTKLGSAATKEHDRLDPPAVAPAAAVPAVVR